MYENENDEMAAYDDFLDEVWGEIEVAGMRFWSSRALKKLDPTAYRCGFLDWQDSSERYYDND